MERKVTVTQRLLEKDRGDATGSTLRMSVMQSHTVGQKNFQIDLRLDFEFFHDGPQGKTTTNINRVISGADCGVFSDAAREIVKIVETSRAFPTSTPRPHTEYTTELVQDLRIGSVKSTNQPSEYFLDVEDNGKPFRYMIGDRDWLDEIRYMFSQAHEYHLSLQQAA